MTSKLAFRKSLPFYLAIALLGGTAALPVLAAPGDAPASPGLTFKKAAPADKRAFESARATEDAGDKVKALQAFILAYPDSHLASRAQWEIFSVLTKRLPQRESEIQQQAKLLVERNNDGLGGALTRAEVADALASAGVDLADAERWARASAVALTEPQFQRWSKSDGDATPPSAAESHRQFAGYRAEVLAELAHVYWRQGKRGQAAAALREALELDADSDEANALQGELALADHQDAQALEFFEKAQLAGELEPRQREQFLTLYRQAHQGSLDGLEQALDARYASMFPSPIKPVHKAATSGNRTVLVELFTGAGCPPCAGADLALDAASEAYDHQQLVVLAFDQHIPRPDPLANPDSVARAKWYGILGTPSFFIDGAAADVNGGDRAESPASYAQLTKAIDARLAQSAPIVLQAKAVLDSAGKLQVEATAHPVPGAPSSSAAVLQVALVEDHVRYSGENGIRFHEAVVRATGGAAEVGIGPAVPDKTLQTSFDLASIESRWHGYLDGYEQHNDRYGPITFLQKPTQFDRANLAVVVYVQDPTSKAVLQSALVPVERH